MNKTIKQIADDLSVSKQTIQYHYQRLPANMRQKDQQGRNVISADAERIIRDKVAKPLPPKNHHGDRQVPPKSNKKSDDLITAMKGEIAYLRADRDKQFAAKDQQIEKLQKLLDQSQQLQLMAEQKIKQLEAPQKEPEGAADNQDKQVHTNTEDNEKKPSTAQNEPRARQGFWARLFGPENNK